MIIKVLMVSSTSYKLSMITIDTCVVPLPVKPCSTQSYILLGKLPSFHIPTRLSRACLVLPHSGVDHINGIQGQAQELVLVIPSDILLLELLRLLRWWRRVRDFRDEIGR